MRGYFIPINICFFQFASSPYFIASEEEWYGPFISREILLEGFLYGVEVTHYTREKTVMSKDLVGT